MFQLEEGGEEGLLTSDIIAQHSQGKCHSKNAKLHIYMPSMQDHIIWI